MRNERPPEVLIVEDDGECRRGIVGFLEDCGFTIRESVSGLDALASSLANPPDVVVTDLRMPGMGGLDLLAALHESLPRMPVIILSGTADRQLLARSLERGAAGYLSKPINDLTKLEEMIDDVVARVRP